MIGEHFIEKIICLPGDISLIAQDVLDATLKVKGKPNALHHLGMTMHIYADTWAHQRFAGVLHDINEVDGAKETDISGVFDKNLGSLLGMWFVEKAVPPLGHGRAQIFPDMPFLSWQYNNGRGDLITRNNVNIFSDAAAAMCKFMQKYRNAPENGLNADDAKNIQDLFSNTKEQDGEKRHQTWIAAIKQGMFSFKGADISYDATGRNSWKAQALGTAFDVPVYDYQDAFLESNWKKFHDSLQQHRLTLLHEILPKYGICAA